MTDEDIISAIIVAEGGLVDDPDDAGGITNHGITMPTLSAHRGRPVMANDIRTLTVEEAKQIYRMRYLVPFQGITSPELRGLLVDCAVNHGVEQAAKFLQRAAGAKIDGDVGPATLEALEASHWKHVYLKVCADRVRFYGRLITKKPSQAKFAAGWCARVAEFVEAVA